MKTSNEKKNQESPFVSLLINIVIPSVVLMKLSKDAYLGPTWGLVVALAFPLFYGLRDFKTRHKVNFVSVLGLVSILLTGGIGLLQLDRHWIAVKEAAVPALIGVAIVGSLRTKYPLVKKLLYNDQVLHVERVNEALKEKNNEPAFERLLGTTSLLLAASFFVSAVLNYGLARYILTSDPGTAAFNEELGRMTALSYPVIVLPSMIVLMLALFVLLRGIKKLTGLDMETIFRALSEEKKQN